MKRQKLRDITDPTERERKLIELRAKKRVTLEEAAFYLGEPAKTFRNRPKDKWPRREQDKESLRYTFLIVDLDAWKKLRTERFQAHSRIAS
jgi:hypothetical protein